MSSPSPPSLPPQPLGSRVPIAQGRPSEKGLTCGEHGHLAPIQCGQERGGFVVIPMKISAGVFVGLQKLEFTALAIPGQNREPMSTQGP